MNNKSLLKNFFRYTLLNILGTVSLSCYILADTFFVSRRLGSNGLAALNLAIPVSNFINGVGLMLGVGGAVKFAICKSQQKEEEANRIFSHSVMGAIGFSCLFLFTGLFLSAPIARLLGADAQIFDMTQTYLKVLLLFAPAFLFNNLLISFSRNDGNPGLSMFAMVAGSFSNIFLDYFFMFPLGMGLFGAVFATGLAPIISMMIILPFLLRKKLSFHLVKTKIHFSYLKMIFLLGFPSLVSEFSSGIVIIVFNFLILQLLGNIGVAAYGIIANLSLVVVAIFTGLAQGTQPLASRAYGQNNWRDIRQTLRYALAMLTVLSVVLYGIIFSFAGPLADLFNSEQNSQLHQIAVSGLRYYFTATFFAGLNIIFASFFVSVEQTVPAHLTTLCRGLFFIVPIAFLLAFCFGVTGVWLAFPVTELLVCLMSLIFFRKWTKTREAAKE